jgi:hypothetical protein
MIDLDNLGGALVPTGKKGGDIEFSAPSAMVFRTVEDTYSALTKRVYVVDKSGSMDNYLLGMETVDEFNWPDDALARARARIQEALGRIAALQANGQASPGIDEDFIGALTLEQTDAIWKSFVSHNDELLKAEIVAYGLTGEIGVMRKPAYRSHAMFSKMEGVKRFAADMIRERHEAHPDADTHLIAFDLSAYYAPPGDVEQLIGQVEELHADGIDTNIGCAVEAAIDLCEREASPVNVHHIILVTDALDTKAGEAVAPMVPIMQARNIVLDFIHVISLNELVHAENSWKRLKEYCIMTGGSYTRVDRAASFRARFVEASRKVLLLGAPDPKGLK